MLAVALLAFLYQGSRLAVADDGWRYNSDTKKLYKALIAMSPHGDIQSTFQRRCVAEGGNLVSIHSKAENTFVYNMVNQAAPKNMKPYDWSQNFFIGYRFKPSKTADKRKRRRYYEDGTPTDYEDWSDSEPNNVRIKEECVEIYTKASFYWKKTVRGTWNDIDCRARRFGGICKRDPPKVKNLPKVKKGPPKVNKDPRKVKKGPPKFKKNPPKVKKDSAKVKKDPPKVKKDLPKVKKDPPIVKLKVKKNPFKVKNSPKVIIIKKKDPLIVKKDPPKVKKDPPIVKQDQPKVKQDPPKVKKDPPQVKKDPPKVKNDPPEFDCW